MTKSITLLLALVALTSLVSFVDAHGRMLSPPMRSSLWRFNYTSPINENDDFLSCGYVQAQYNDINQGRCGECGDEWSLPRPRDNDEGGLYGNGIIAGTYKSGAMIDVTIEITINHLGYFEFRLCPKKSADELTTQECLDQNLLSLEDGTTRYPITSFGTGFYNIKVQLPAGITCSNCVLQWYYRGSTRPEPAQETYVNCADIAITA